MSEALRRYLDGELSEDEAQRFLVALDEDPRLEAELRQMELLLTRSRQLADTRLPDGFTEEVLHRVGLSEKSQSFGRRARSSPATRFRWRTSAFSVAAALVLFFTGLQVGRLPDTQPVAIPSGSVTAGAPRLHTVRLVYVPTSSVPLERVHVAGDFNAWNATATPLRQQGAVWVTTLVLPEGEYEYMFVEDDHRWVTDPLAERTRDDGFGGSNGVLDIGI